jgi:hypothetical protein
MKFLHPSEVNRERSNLNTSSTMRVDQYATLVAECSFPDLHYVECQLIDDKGHACRQRFGKGWVARRADGVEVLIGGRCAQKHFLGAGGESLKLFQTHSAELIRKNKLRDANARLEAFKTDSDYALRLAESRARLTELQARAQRERDSLPHAVIERLRRMQRGGARSVPGVVRHKKNVERDGKVIEVDDWRPFSFGVVASPQAIFASTYSAIAATLEAAEWALQAPSDSIAEDLSALTTRLNTFSAALRTVVEIEEADHALRSYSTSENLQTVCWLAINEDDRRRVAMRALELNGKQAKLHDAKLALLEWQRKIRSGNGDREIQPVQ